MATFVCPIGASRTPKMSALPEVRKWIADDYIDPETLSNGRMSGLKRSYRPNRVSKEVVEKDIALNAATKLSEWAKVFAIAVGVPATIVVGILAFIGVNLDFSCASRSGW